jgi:hypothetical protein
VYRPLSGLDWSDPFNWPYIAAVIASPVVLLCCLVTLFIGGWLVGLLWILFVLWLAPEEVEEANRRPSQSDEARS